MPALQHKFPTFSRNQCPNQPAHFTNHRPTWKSHRHKVYRHFKLPPRNRIPGNQNEWVRSDRRRADFGRSIEVRSKRIMNLICTSDPRRRGPNLPERMGNIHVTRILMNSFRESEWGPASFGSSAIMCGTHTYFGSFWIGCWWRCIEG